MDAHANDMAEALTDSVAKDGQTEMTGDLPMGTHKVKNLGEAHRRDGRADLRINCWLWVFRSYLPIWSAELGMPLLSLRSPAITVHEIGKGFRFFAENANTDEVTVAKSAGWLRLPLHRSDGTAMEADDIEVGTYIVAIFDGSNLRTNIAPAVEAGAPEHNHLYLDIHANLDAAGDEMTAPDGADRLVASDERRSRRPAEVVELYTLPHLASKRHCAERQSCHFWHLQRESHSLSEREQGQRWCLFPRTARKLAFLPITRKNSS